MGDDHHGHAVFRQVPHDLQHLAHHFGVQGGGGLVKEHHLRLHHESPDDGHPLLLAAGELAGVGVRPVGKAHPGQKLHGLLLCLRLGAVQQLHGGQGHVLQDGHVGEEVEVLEDHAHLLAVEVDVVLGVRDVGPVQADGAAGGDLQKVQAAEEGGLAGAGGPDDHHHLAFADVGADAVQGLDLPALIVFLQVLHLNEGISAHCRATSFPAG